ncbi:MAG: hypothetical protein ACRDBY_14215 [Cetobacterium sp.]
MIIKTTHIDNIKAKLEEKHLCLFKDDIEIARLEIEDIREIKNLLVKATRELNRVEEKGDIIMRFSGAEGLGNIREYLGLTRKEFEKYCPELGVGYTTNLELGNTKNPSFYNVYCLANGFLKIMNDRKITIFDLKVAMGQSYPIFSVMEVVARERNYNNVL